MTVMHRVPHYWIFGYSLRLSPRPDMIGGDIMMGVEAECQNFLYGEEDGDRHPFDSKTDAMLRGFRVLDEMEAVPTTVFLMTVWSNGQVELEEIRKLGEDNG